jgi:hypothetical protein
MFYDQHALEIVRSRLVSTPWRLSSAMSLRIRRIAGSREIGLSRHQWSIGAVLVLALAFYTWTAASTYPITFTGQGLGGSAPQSAPGIARGAYNLLATALLHGHLYLPVHPDSQFLHLAHPYRDGGTIEHKKYHDLIWHGRHFYSAWGPSPVLLFLVVQIVSLGSLAMSQTLAVVVYSFLGLLGAVGLLHILVRRLLPRTPGWLLTVGSIGIALMNVAPYLLRRPAQYEVAISGAYAFEMVGLWLLASAIWSDSLNLPKLAAASSLLGLAVAARPTLITGGLPLIAATIWATRGQRDRVLIAFLAVGPFLISGLLLAAYNAARFGSPFELGYAYQLASPPVAGRHINDLAYLLPGLFGYLVMPPRLTVAFPYVSLLPETQSVYPLTLPASYAGGTGGWPVETASGLLTAVPLTLGLVSIPWLLRRKTPDLRTATLVALLLTLSGVVGLVLVTLGMWLTTERYETDYMTYFLLAAFLTWAVLLAHAAERPIARTVITVAGSALGALGAIVGFAISLTGPFDLLQERDAGTFDTLEDSFSPVPTLVSKIIGAPLIASIRGPYVQPPTDVGPFDIQETDATVSLANQATTFTLVAPSSGTYVLSGRIIPASSKGALNDGKIRVSRMGYRSSVVVVSRDRLVRVPLELHTGINRVSFTVPGRRTRRPLWIFAGIKVES